MTTNHARYSRQEFRQRGDDIYEREIRPVLQPHDENKFVAIDIESAGYEIDRDDYTATERLLARYPNAQIWMMRIGQPAAYRVGGRLVAGEGE